MELLKRLKIIEACINLQDHALIAQQLPLLKNLDSTSDIDAIITLLEQHNYVQAQEEIVRFLNAQQSIVLYEDAQLNAIRLELSAYEEKLQVLLLRRNEAYNRLRDFNREYHLKLGPLLLRILSLQEKIAEYQLTQKLRDYQTLRAQFVQHKQYLQTLKKQRQELDEKLQSLDFLSDDYSRLIDEYLTLSAEITGLEEVQEAIRQEALKEYQTVKGDDTYQSYQQAQESTHSFEQEYEEVKEVVVARLDEEEVKQLKALYRKACRLCHPDLVSDELKDQAHEFMVDVNAAYETQDLPRLQSIVAQLEGGGKLKRFSDLLSDKDALIAKLAELKTRYQQVLEELESYESSDDYQEVLALGDNWDSYFINCRQELEIVADELEKKLKILSAEEYYGHSGLVGLHVPN